MLGNLHLLIPLFQPDHNQSPRHGFEVFYLDNIVGPCSRWVWVLECWKFFRDLLTYVSTWGWRQFLIRGHFILRPEAAWECLMWLTNEIQKSSMYSLHWTKDRDSKNYKDSKFSNDVFQYYIEIGNSTLPTGCIWFGAHNFSNNFRQPLASKWNDLRSKIAVNPK